MQIRNVKDVQDSQGMWMRSYQLDGYQQHTRAGCVWAEMKKRTTEGSYVQKINPQYAGSKVIFENFQCFAQWAQEQYGYMRKEAKGNFWSIDKDILVPGNKDYGPKTCIFVTSAANSLLTDSRSARGIQPLGVDFQTHIRKYRARCADGNKVSKYLGTFNTAYEAHRAWQKAKINTIEYVISSDESCILQPRLVTALEFRIEILKSDLREGKITLKL